MAKLKVIIAVIVVIFLVAMLGSGLYLTVVLSHIKAPPSTTVTHVRLNTSLSAYVSYQNALDYNSSTLILPYSLVSYSASNISKVYFNATLLKSPFPVKVYILNATSDCVNCAGISLFYGDVNSSLKEYGLGSMYPNVTIINMSSVASIENDSILIIPTGLLPSVMLGNYSNTTLIGYLLGKGTSIIYIGQSFSRVILPDGIIVPNSNVPYYMVTGGSSVTHRPDFYFNSSTFSFTIGNNFGSATYVNALNGSIVAFSNYLDSWNNVSDAADDMAKAISLGFWLPRYSYGISNISINPSKHDFGAEGIIMNQPKPINYTPQNMRGLLSGNLRVVLYTNSSYLPGKTYYYLSSFPSYGYNGSISMPGLIIPNVAEYITMEVFTHSATPIGIQPHLTIYNINMSTVSSIPLPYISASGNFTFVKYMKLLEGPGRYIITLDSFSNQQYAAALFDIPNVSIREIAANYTHNIYRFYITAAGVPLSGISYNVTLNGNYRSNGTINNGTLLYALPSTVGIQYGKLKYNFSMLSTHLIYSTSNPAPVIHIGVRDISLIVVIIVVLLMVTMVRAPNRDEFYIDVPRLPKQQKTAISLKAQDVVNTFTKLNIFYHWRYMPLSKAEIKVAIANNIRYNGIPVTLTEANIEVVLDQLVGAGLLVTAGDLYAPKEWIAQSGHDIEYLAIFKKLRLYCVTHAYVFTDLDSAENADTSILVHGEKRNIIIYAPTSKFKSVTITANSKTYLVFLDENKMQDFKDLLYSKSDPAAEELKLYISAGYIKLVSVDDIDYAFE
ncbi:hypothetical protein M1373_01435 [Candidatus Marsarchaeota archaeon]|nr:hypothetical protein [Candidatus Marsarchaeota archaeon]MCL5404960.1 hypothetical protein [Candidatus Marsarchaeota archaeon]